MANIVSVTHPRRLSIILVQVCCNRKPHSENTFFSHFYPPPLMLRKATSIPIQPILLKLEAIHNFPSVEKRSEATRIYAVPRNALNTFPEGCRKICSHRGNCYAKNQNKFYFITLASVIYICAFIKNTYLYVCVLGLIFVRNPYTKLTWKCAVCAARDEIAVPF